MLVLARQRHRGGQQAIFASHRPGHSKRPLTALLVVKTASDYQRAAQECRRLADRFPPGPDREQLLSMAQMWDGLARDRADLIQQRREPTSCRIKPLDSPGR